MLHIYTDGSCTNNGLEGATATWGFTVTTEDNMVLESATGRVTGEQNNNRAELFGFLKALKYINSCQESCMVHVDYEALYLFCNGKSNPKANRDLYNQIDRLWNRVENRTMVVKVKAHKGRKSGINHYINGLVDKMARKALVLFSTPEEENIFDERSAS